MAIRKANVNENSASDFLGFEGIPFHAKTMQSVYEILKTDYTGLIPSEVHIRQESYGDNIIGAQGKSSPQGLFLNQCRKAGFYLLFAAAIVTLLLGEIGQAILIFSAWAVINGLNLAAMWVGEKSLKGIGSLEGSICRVRREGKTFDLPSDQLVPGDILILASGAIVPADARLISADNLQVDESLVTGESTLITKDARAILIPDQDITEQTNMVFAGSRVKTGKSEAVVTAIGCKTLMGSIANLAGSSEKREAALSGSLKQLTQTLLFMGVILSVALGGIHLYQGFSVLSTLQIMLVMVVAAIPEMLIPLVTMLFSLGIRNLSAKSILVKNFHAVESIGTLTVLCTDKTGTLTENALTMQRIFLPELGDVEYNPMWKEAKSVPNVAIESFLRIARMNNSTVMDGIRSAFVGDPIDIALYRASSSVFERGYYCIKELPFDQTTLRSATIIRGPEGKLYAYIKGAPESVLSICNSVLKTDGGNAPLHSYDRDEFLLRNQELALESALRVIGFARKELLDEHDDPFTGATFVAWACLVDPPKEGALEGVKLCQESGLRMVMITGDQKATAAVTAKKLGILQDQGEIWTRKDLDAGVDQIPQAVCVFARTKPEEKLAIVESLQKSGDIVGMVGDGVNDMPALLKSDVSIAMGMHGTDSAQECSDMVLLNDRFDNIVEAVRESRQIIRNVGFSIQYMVSCHLSLVILAAFLGILSLSGLIHYKTFPLAATQMLWLNVVMICLPTLTLALMPSGGDSSLNRTPVRPDFMQKNQLAFPLLLGALMALTGTGTYLVAKTLLNASDLSASTLMFFSMATVQLLNLLSIHLKASGLSAGQFLKEIFQVPIIGLVLAGSVLTQLALYLIPACHELFHLGGVSPLHWLLPICTAVLMTAISLGFSQTDEKSS
jgi:Ca2+-transporting ATPase